MRRSIDASAAEVVLTSAPDVVAGRPCQGVVDLGGYGDHDLGIWEITPGTVRDVESDEIFVVLAGEATVRFDTGEVLELGPGVVARLHAGERTVWDVRSRLRKVFLA